MAASLVVSFIVEPDPSDVGFFIYCSPGTSAGRTRNAKRNYKLIYIESIATFGGPYTIDIILDYTARYGAVVAGQRIFVLVRFFNASGFTGEAVATSAIVQP